MNNEGAEIESSKGGGAAERPFRILVVDDDKEAARAIVLALEYLGHAASSCGHAQEALDRVITQSYDLLLVDYRMPDLTGLDLITVLRQDGCKIPAIVMTGHFATEDRIPAEQLGICAILRKPLTLPMLARALEEPLLAAGQGHAHVSVAPEPGIGPKIF